jgi:hypothetical protein
MQTLRWTGLAVCTVLTAVSLVYGIVYLTEGSAGPGGSNLAWAALFAGSTVLLWRRGGRSAQETELEISDLGLVRRDVERMAAALTED